jgi:hypothetical protein
VFTRFVSLLAALLLPQAVLAQATFPKTCPNGADLPFAPIAVTHPIDSSCAAPEGQPSSPASKLQNVVKNNFCATGQTPPERYTPAMLVALQKDTAARHVSSGRGHEPKRRTVLHELGEGTLVRMKAFLVEAHFADLGGGESVNCQLPSADENDVHIALGPAAGTQECASVTAEISPHYRPASWNEIGNFKTDAKVASRLQAQPYRITGQLFFDGSHKTCPCSAAKCGGNPRRASLWEIHPVYKIEVCKSGAPCDDANDSDWLAFDAWWSSPAPGS